MSEFLKKQWDTWVKYPVWVYVGVSCGWFAWKLYQAGMELLS